MKNLVINADDFGFTSDVNAGIVHAHREGVLTSTTLMATGDAFDDAIRLAKENPTLDVGCHLVLIQGRALTTGRPFPDTPAQVAVSMWKHEASATYAELRAQIEKIQSAGIRATHLDSHKHTHILPQIFRMVVRLAHEFRVPYVRLPLDETAPYARTVCRAIRPLYSRVAAKHGVRMTDHFLGYRLTGTLTETTLLAALAKLREGTTEFMCHPGYLGPELQRAATRLKQSRVRELEALTSPRVRRFMDEAGVRLATFDTATLVGRE
ncbi:MAG: ChbG/HpnK family deacetylase [Acidobacteriaceae bacterium]|nr:ChbG/HpnK family deacetylase [Acidobacteriaceae bacterium]